LAIVPFAGGFLHHEDTKITKRRERAARIYAIFVVFVSSW
jgi:hypothetical protein